jgi:FAD/FMN-containing dehydrogenase
MVETSATIDTVALSAFRERFSGQIVLPDDGLYDAARRVWNGRVDRRPAVVVRPTSREDVVASVRFARDRDLALAVRGGGHAVAGHGTCDGGLVIDLSRLHGVTVDPERRVAQVLGGSLLGELDDAAQAHGLVCPVGVVSHTGVGGLTLGGGIGRLQRRFGLTIDNLRSVELVTADGRQVRASRDENPDLFWGMRGAGPNFGIVTDFEFDLHPMAPDMARRFGIYPAKRARELWGLFHALVAGAPDEMALSYGVGRAVPEADYPPEVAGQPVVYIGLGHSGTAEAAVRDLAALDAAGTPLIGSTGRAAYLEVQRASDDAMAWGHRTYSMGAFADDLPEPVLDALVDQVARSRDGDDSVSFGAFGGAVGRRPDDDAAFTGRMAFANVGIESFWDDLAQDDAHLAWVRETTELLDPHMAVGRYAGEVTDDDEDTVRSIYGPAKYERLQVLKRTWDPENVFRVNLNVRL